MNSLGFPHVFSPKSRNMALQKWFRSSFTCLPDGLGRVSTTSQADGFANGAGEEDC